jgi:hypothetical protein
MAAIVPKQKGKTGIAKSSPNTNTTDIVDDGANIELFKYNPKDIPMDESVITIQGKKVGSCGNAVVITGKPKSRKSVVAHAMVCSAVSGNQILGVDVNLPISRNKVLLIDTEQNAYDLHNSLSRMQSLGGFNIMPSNLLAYRFRELNAESIKASITKLLSDDSSISMAVIDGGLDLLNNMNDIIEVKETIDWVKKTLSKFNICMVMIIHQSKSTQFTIGHFGSFMDRFGQTNIEVVKLESGGSEIRCQHMRSDSDFNPYEFYWNYNTNNYSVHWLAEDTISYNKVTDYPDHKHKAMIATIFNKNDAYLYKDFCKQCETTYKKSGHWVKGLVEHLYSINLIVKEGNKIIQFDSNKIAAEDNIPF